MKKPLPPHSSTALVDQGGRASREFYTFLLALADRAGVDLTNELQALSARIDALEGEKQGLAIRAIGSIVARDGVLSLIGDTDNPGGSSYYGSDVAGNRGWWRIIDAIAAGAGLVKSIPADGYNVLGELDDASELPPSASVNDAYLIDGDYWVWGGSDWANAGPPSNTAMLSLYAGVEKDDGLLWNGDPLSPGYEVAPIVRNPMTDTGDLIYADPGKSPARLGIGGDGMVLTAISGKPTWAPSASGALNLDGGRADSVYGGTTSIDGGNA